LITEASIGFRRQLVRRHEPRTATNNSQKKSGSQGTSEANTLYEAALRHMREGRYTEAQVSCQQALAVTPTHAVTLHLMGILCFRSRQFDQAVEWLARAIRQDPRPEYLSSLGTPLQQQARHAEALQTFDKAIQLKPDSAGADRRRHLERGCIERSSVDLNSPRARASGFPTLGSVYTGCMG
jgi:tetratricopeptide (TPR) repeat protein